MDRLYTQQLGDDLESAAAGFLIRAIAIDNPSGSWLHVDNLGEYVPPFTVGWQRDFPYGIASVTVRFANSPSGTPSQNVGGPVSIRIHDTEIGSSAGYASGASEIQTGLIGNLSYYFTSFRLREASTTPAALPPPGIATARIELVGWQVHALPGHDTYTDIRTPVTVLMIDGLGSDLFPPGILSPESPVVPWTPPTGRGLLPGSGADIGGVVSRGGGAVDVGVMVKYYVVEVD